MLARTLILAIAAGLIPSACSKTEPPPPPKPPIPKTAAATPAAPTKTEIDSGLKERLARQEAAARMFESKVLLPAPPKAPEPPPAAVKSPEPAAPKASPTQAPASATPAPRLETAKAGPAKAEPPKPAPATPQPAPASPSTPPTRTDVAATRPPLPAPEPQPAARLVTKVDPDFPREAAAAGVEQGVVKARMTLDASGGVTRVDVLDANPRRVFDRAVMRALSQWRYNEGAAGRTVDLEVAFRR